MSVSPRPSAAFDTIDHSILLTRLSSWFGIHGCVLNCFKSYLSSRSFRVRCSIITLSRHCIPLPVVFPKAPFLVLCFSSCTPPPQYSHLFHFPQPPPLWRRHPTVFLILPARLRLKHYPPTKCPSANLFLDDCQFPNSQFIQYWILTHLTQKKQLNKIYNSSLNTTGTLPATLASSSMNILPSTTKFQLSLHLHGSLQTRLL